MGRGGIVLLQRVRQHEFDHADEDVFIKTAIDVLRLSGMIQAESFVREVIDMCDHDLAETSVRLGHLVDLMNQKTGDLEDIRVMIDEFATEAERYHDIRTLLVERMTQVQQNIPKPWNEYFYKNDTNGISDLTLINLARSLWPKREGALADG